MQEALPGDTATGASASTAPAAPSAAAGETAANRDNSDRWASFAAAPGAVNPQREFPWRSCFSRSAATWQVPEPLLLAVASGARVALIRWPVRTRDAVGIMQIRWPLTARHLDITSEEQLYDPCINIDAGARYLRELLSQYQGDYNLAVAAYNYGPTPSATGLCA